MYNQPTANSQQPTANPLLSVIITSYNEIEYLPQAIESVLSQTFQDIEIIIGDDGSDDGSIELIEKYCEKYPDKIKYFVMERNIDKNNFIPVVRHSQVFKTAFQKARGKYFLCLDGDDYFCDDTKFYDAVSFLESHKNYAGYMSGHKWVHTDGSENIYSIPIPYYPRSIFWAFMYMHVSGCVFQRDVFDKGYILKRLCSDTAVTFSIISAGKMYFTDKITYAYRQREESMSHKPGKLELYVLELMLFQECLCTGRFKWSSYSRYYGPLRFVYCNRESLKDSSYEKFFRKCEDYDNNILGEIASCDSNLKIKFHVLYMLFRGKFASLFFRWAYRFYMLPFRIIRKCKKILSRN